MKSLASMKLIQKASKLLLALPLLGALAFVAPAARAQAPAPEPAPTETPASTPGSAPAATPVHHHHHHHRRHHRHHQHSNNSDTPKGSRDDSGTGTRS